VEQSAQRSQLDRLDRELDIVIDAVAELRSDYQDHTHG